MIPGKGIDAGPVEGEAVELVTEDIEVNVQDKAGYITETEGELFASLYIELTKELVQEGFAREIINKVQFMRKEADFNVTDRIRLHIESTEIVREAVESFREYVMSETLTREMVNNPGDGFYTKEWSINGEETVIGIEQIG